MTRDRSHDPPTSAADLMRELQLDPEFRAQEHKRQSAQLRHSEHYRQAAEPLLHELNEAGVQVEQVADLRSRPDEYGRALPILVSWLPRISYDALKEDVVRTLSMPAAKLAARPLIQEFTQAKDVSPGLRWAIANALEVVADDAVFNEIAELALDKQWGTAREMLAMALGNMRNPRAVTVLTELLGDEETVGHAVVALGRLRAASARPVLEKLKDHPKEWIREEVAKALANLP